MDFVFWIILIILIVGVVWWFMNRSRSAKGPEASGAEGTRADGALSGGSAAASAEAAGTAGIAGAAGFGRPAEPAAPTTAEEPAGVKSVTPEADTAPPAGSMNHDSSAAPGSGEREAGGTSTAPAAVGQDERRRQDEDEWQTQWSEASGSSAVTPGGAKAASRDEAAIRMAHGGPHEGAEQGRPAGAGGGPATAGLHAEPAAPAAASRPVHHPEYTEPHAPTLPGAETAAVEEADDAGPAPKAPAPASAEATAHPVHGVSASSPAGAGVVPDSAAATETADRTQSSAVVETGADHARQPEPAAVQEPAGHLAAEEPYGAGSAAAKADGSGPANYTVKGDAGAMVYYEEGHPDYEQARAEVWFESPAHAEAAGFRAPRRRRL